MEEVEGRVLGWLRERHALLAGRASVTQLLKDCVARSVQPQAALAPLFADLAEALDHLEQVQSGLVR